MLRQVGLFQRRIFRRKSRKLHVVKIWRSGAATYAGLEKTDRPPRPRSVPPGGIVNPNRTFQMRGVGPAGTPETDLLAVKNYSLVGQLMLMRLFVAVLVAAACLSSEPARAASTLDGASMAWPWAVPFIGILLSIATGPLLFPKTWHGHYGKIALGWAAVTLAPLAVFHGASAALAAFLHTMIAEYMSFILLLFALYTVAGGILVTGSIRANPRNNAGALALGTLIASIVGTTGAAMILIRPLIRTNGGRKHNAHVIVFFIILAANVGGALTPVGDPPLFVGFLHGVPFFWTTQHLWLQTVIVAVPVLALFVAVDLWYFRKEPARSAPVEPLRLHGSLNLVLIGMIVAAVLLSATGEAGHRIEYRRDGDRAPEPAS